jgi:BirA family biotin operon repressor/biotin-[acetyl-CoA-carboxylase] ligase
VLGIGINVNSLPDDFPTPLRPTVTTLRILNGGNLIDRNHLAGALLAELTALYQTAGTGFSEILSQMHRRSLLLGRRIQFQQQGAWREGELTGFGESGEMEVRIGTRTELVAAAEMVRLADNRA